MTDRNNYRDSKYDGLSYYETVTAAVADMAKWGFDTEARLEAWLVRLKASAERSMPSPEKLARDLRAKLETDYDKLVERGGLQKRHVGIPRFTIERLKPSMRAELDRRVMASTSLIRLNRQRAVDHTLQRFGGWATSVPSGGVSGETRTKVKEDVKKSIKQLPFEERRVIIDQSHKLYSAINNIVATHGGAIAGIWHSHYKEKGYNFRKIHAERDGKFYAIKGNWAIQKGLMNKGAGYYEDMDQVGQEPFCRCYMQYIYGLDRLPDEMLTEKGRAALAELDNI